MSKPSAHYASGSHAPITPDHQVGTQVYVTIHGHFYQPPRENPWTGRIERQPSAAPYHDWNERIWAECYRPNAFARILDDQGRVLEIINNFEYLSFNIGPTLLSWLETHDLEVYQRILAADRSSCQRLQGHGNAIAQVYNHVILPLATPQDQEVQIHWGIADFRHRFGRDPEGMWLAETAIDWTTVEILVKAGIRFVILAPSQAQRCRPLCGEAPWQDVSAGQIDPSRPYRCFLPDRSGYLDIFFFDGPISRDMGFGEVLGSSYHLAQRLGGAVQPHRETPQIIQCATDGETFGHHKRGVEKTLAYAFTHEFPQRGWQVTNYAHFLSLHPPTWEVEIKPRTAWSCAHGVGRWERDCGCGGSPGGHLRWRKPLREALNWLRDELGEIFAQRAPQYLRDPERARLEYISVILQPQTRRDFLETHQARPLHMEEQIEVWRLLEMQRYAQLMFTSCGWFFEELSRPEGVQILRYAAKAIELAAEVSGVNLDPAFQERLSVAPTNAPLYPSGAVVYRELVLAAVVPPAQVVAHYAISRLFEQHSRQESCYGYVLEQVDHQRRRLGDSTLEVGRIRLHSGSTQESHDYIYGVLHLEGWDFHCGVKLFSGRRQYETLKQQLLQPLGKVETLLGIHDFFGQDSFNLSHLLVEDRQRMMHRLTQHKMGELSQLYQRTYLDHYSVMLAFRRDGLPLPEELQVAAQLTLNQRFLTCLWHLESEQHSDQYQEHSAELAAIVQEAEQLGCRLQQPEAVQLMGRILHQVLWKLAHSFTPAESQVQIQLLDQWLHITVQAGLRLEMDRLQELYLTCLERQIAPRCRLWPEQDCEGIPTPALLQLLRLGQLLNINTRTWLARLAQVEELADQSR